MRKIASFFLLVIFAGGLILPGVRAFEEESILSYHSEITIQDTGKLIVQETITVRALGNSIKRGIYRDYPTKYPLSHGFRQTVPFRVISIKKDNASEPYRIEQLKNGVRIYIGDADVYLDQGIYTYQITYEADRLIGFFENHDELYYNITGNGWEFPIESASAEIHFPSAISADSLKTDVFTGSAGSTEHNATVSIATDEHGAVMSVETIQPLSAYEGLTVLVGWPKGAVAEPSRTSRMVFFLKDNIGLFSSLLLSIFAVIYGVFIWLKVGRDPRPRTLVTRFEPPEDPTAPDGEKAYLSPALTRIVNRMGYDDKTMTAALVHLAIQGAVHIKQEKASFTVTRQDNTSENRTPDETLLLDALFPDGKQSFTFKQADHARIAKLKAEFQKNTGEKSRALYHTNYRYLVPGIVSVLLSALFLFFNAAIGPESGFTILWLSMWSLGTAALIYRALQPTTSVINRIGLIIPALIFSGFLIFGVIVLLTLTPIVIILPITLQIVVLGMLLPAIKARTRIGRTVQDQIEGLRHYLTVAEERRYEMMHKTLPETIRMYESYLPYAIALDIEPQWSKTLDAALKALAPDEKTPYTPVWYTGTRSYTSASSLASSVGSAMATTISASSVAPGSSSGFGGGGGSGGGGGGGGGGGW